MMLENSDIIGIAVATLALTIIIIVLVHFIIKKRRNNAEYRNHCGNLSRSYENRKKRPKIMTTSPYAAATFVSTAAPGQRFTARELRGEKPHPFVIPGRIITLDSKPGSDAKHKPVVSMNAPLEPDTINPQLYRNAYDQKLKEVVEPCPPQVYFSVDHEEDSNLLKVYVERAKHIRPIKYTDVCNPYCTVAIIPGYHERKSQIKQRTVDPKFQEEFSFPFAKSELKEKSIQINFFDFDPNSRHECIGTVLLPLRDVNLALKTDFWRKVAHKGAANGGTCETAGDLLLRLNYSHSDEMLTVVVLKARSLRKVERKRKKGLPDPYVRVTVIEVGKSLKKKKTSTKMKTCNPTYNQAIRFSVARLALPHIEIQCHVIHEKGGDKSSKNSKKELIGYLKISSTSSGNELQQWEDLLRNKSHARWHHLETPNIKDSPLMEKHESENNGWSGENSDEPLRKS